MTKECNKCLFKNVSMRDYPCVKCLGCQRDDDYWTPKTLEDVSHNDRMVRDTKLQIFAKGFKAGSEVMVNTIIDKLLH